MSITTRPGATFTAYVTNAPQDLEGTLTLGIRSLPSETVVSAAATTGISETQLGDSTSNYAGTRTAPTDTTLDYEVVWTSGSTVVTEDLHVSGPALPEEVTPTLADVALKMQAWIVDDGNNYETVWDDESTPTAAQVAAMADVAARDVQRDLGPTLTQALTDEDSTAIGQAADLAAIRAAMYVVESFYAQNTERDENTYPLLKRLYDEGIRAMRRRGGMVSVELATPYSGDDVDYVGSRLDFNFG